MALGDGMRPVSKPVVTSMVPILLLGGITFSAPSFTAQSGLTFPVRGVLAFAGIAVATVVVFLYSLRKSGEYTGVFYLLAVSLLALWIINSSPEVPSGFLSSINNSLSKLGFVDLQVSPETAFYVYVYILLLLVSGLFYTAPKHSRDLGFLVFGMLFSIPFFRDILYPPHSQIFGLTAFVLSLAIATSLVFSPNVLTATLQTLLLAAVTVLAIAAQPWAIAVPFAFVLTFPRKKRNAAYMAFVLAGLFFLSKTGPLVQSSWVPLSLDEVAAQTLVPLALLGYTVTFKVRGIKAILGNTKGPTPFLLLLLMAYLLGLFLNPDLVPYAVIVLTVLSVRMVYHLRNIEGRRVKARTRT